jgi:hypothetical protein
MVKALQLEWQLSHGGNLLRTGAMKKGGPSLTRPNSPVAAA